MKKLSMMVLFVVLLVTGVSAQNVLNGDPVVAGKFYVNFVQSFGIGSVNIILKNGSNDPIGTATANTFAGNSYCVGTGDIFFWNGSLGDVRGMEIYRGSVRHHDFTFNVIPPGGFTKDIHVGALDDNTGGGIE